MSVPFPYAGDPPTSDLDETTARAIDDAISADLDGELDALAAEHGTTATDVRARLAGWSGGAARRAELDAARTAVAHVGALDDVTRRRLLAGVASPAMRDLPSPAVRPQSRSARRPWLLVGAGAAAALLVVMVGVAALQTRTSNTVTKAGSALDQDATASAPERPATAGTSKDAPSAPAPDRAGETASTKTPARTEADASVGDVSDARTRAALAGAGPPPSVQSAGPNTQCVTDALAARGITPQWWADATFDGRPVLFVVASGGPRGYVVDPATCRVIAD